MRGGGLGCAFLPRVRDEDATRWSRPRRLLVGATGRASVALTRVDGARSHHRRERADRIVLGRGTPRGRSCRRRARVDRRKAAARWRRTRRGSLFPDGIDALLGDNGALTALVDLASFTSMVDSWNVPLRTFDLNGRAGVALAFGAARRDGLHLVHASSARSSDAPPSRYRTSERRSLRCRLTASRRRPRTWRSASSARRSGPRRAISILYLSESPRRPSFALRKIVRAVAAIRRGESDTLLLGNTEAVRDFCHARDVAAAAMLLALGARPATTSVPPAADVAFGTPPIPSSGWPGSTGRDEFASTPRSSGPTTSRLSSGTTPRSAASAGIPRRASTSSSASCWDSNQRRPNRLASGFRRHGIAPPRDTRTAPGAPQRTYAVADAHRRRSGCESSSRQQTATAATEGSRSTRATSSALARIRSIPKSSPCRGGVPLTEEPMPENLDWDTSGLGGKGRYARRLPARRARAARSTSSSPRISTSSPSRIQSPRVPRPARLVAYGIEVKPDRSPPVVTSSPPASTPSSRFVAIRPVRSDRGRAAHDSRLSARERDRSLCGTASRPRPLDLVARFGLAGKRSSPPSAGWARRTSGSTRDHRPPRVARECPTSSTSSAATARTPASPREGRVARHRRPRGLRRLRARQIRPTTTDLADSYSMPGTAPSSTVTRSASASSKRWRAAVPVVGARPEDPEEAGVDGALLARQIDPTDTAAIARAIIETFAMPREIPAGLARFGYGPFEKRAHAIVDDRRLHRAPRRAGR